MNIKDFQKGQTVYILDMHKGRNTEPTIYKAVVDSVGRKYVTTGLFFKNTNANNIRIYGDNAYIFCRETLITVIPVPANIKKDMDKMIRR